LSEGSLPAPWLRLPRRRHVRSRDRGTIGDQGHAPETAWYRSSAPATAVPASSEQPLKFLAADLAVPKDLREQAPTDGLTPVYGHGCTPPVGVADEVVAPLTLATSKPSLPRAFKSLAPVGAPNSLIR